MIKVEVSGNVGATPRSTNGHTFFSVASTDKDKNGNKTTEWVNICVFAGSNIDVTGIDKGVYVTVKGFGKLETFKEKTSLSVNAREKIAIGFPGKKAEHVDDEIPF